MKKIAILLVALTATFTTTQSVYAHCEVPCGIYGDMTRIDLIREHIATIEKAMNQINTISSEKSPNYNQLVRWVNNKEEHAEKIQTIVSQYFLHQRIKLGAKPGTHEHEDYLRKLTLCHELLVYSMKAKQSTDLAVIEKLKSTIDAFEKAYNHKH